MTQQANSESEQQEVDRILALIKEENDERKRVIEPRKILELKDCVEQLKVDYSKNYDKYIDIQLKIQLAKRLGLSDQQQYDDLAKIEKEHQRFLQQFDQLRKELFKHTLGLFYVREEALNVIMILDKIKGGQGLKPREFQ